MIDDICVYPGVDPSSAPDMHKREWRNTPSVDIARLVSPYRDSGHQSTLASVASCPGSSGVADGAHQQSNRGVASSELWIGNPCTYVLKQFTSEQDE